MDRKKFLQSLALTTGITVVNPLGLLDFFSPIQETMLPFPRGVMKKVVILKERVGAVEKLNAQYVRTPYGYHQGYNYNYLAQYNQMYAYQQAAAQWNAYYQQQQQYYAWFQNEYQRQMQALLQQYSNYQQISAPKVMEHIRSLYAFANNPGSSPTLFGLNSQKSDVAIKNTLKGAASVWDEVSDYYSEKEAQKTVGPQTSEGRAAIKIPGNIILNGRGYETKNGGLGVSNDLVQTEDGEVGNLVKYKTGPDGEQYMVI